MKKTLFILPLAALTLALPSCNNSKVVEPENEHNYTLDEYKFGKITRIGCLNDVLSGIEEAINAIRIICFSYIISFD